MISEIQADRIVKEEMRAPVGPDSIVANLELWIAALRNGEYKQGHAKLREDNLFCCLGVACDIMNPDAWEYKGEESYLWHIENYCYASLDKYTQEAFGINVRSESNLIRLNDQYNYSFNQIADYIEKKILPDYIELARIKELENGS